MYRKLFKPTLDFTGALGMILFSAPIWILTAIMLLIQNKGKIFFIQERVGKDGKVFNIVKFKTMADKFGEDKRLLPDNERISGIGKIIRNISIDELPQMINILKGEMSFVGPRPLLPEYLPFYDKNQMRRHEVKPGISGWAQCHGRNAISWSKKFELDCWYVDNISFLTDCKICFLTIKDLLDFKNMKNKVRENVVKFNGRN